MKAKQEIVNFGRFLFLIGAVLAEPLFLVGCVVWIGVTAGLLSCGVFFLFVTANPLFVLMFGLGLLSAYGFARFLYWDQTSDEAKEKTEGTQ